MSHFDRELERLMPRLRQYAWTLTRNAVQADDLLQASLTQALEKRAYWTAGSDLRAWLFTIMHNLFVTEWRRAANAPVAVVADLEQWEVGRPATQDSGLLMRDLERALAKLSAEQRDLLLLAGLHEVTYKDLCTRLGLPMGTVKSKLFRARETLRSLIDGHDKAELAAMA
jgi:RNA polymerase sigma-70 factor, ECF subfamily